MSTTKEEEWNERMFQVESRAWRARKWNRFLPMQDTFKKAEKQRNEIKTMRNFKGHRFQIAEVWTTITRRVVG